MAKYVHRHTHTLNMNLKPPVCLQYSGHAGNIHQYLHHSCQHPLHLCHLLLCEGKLRLIMLLFILLHFLLQKCAQLSILSLCLAALPCCYADCVQEDCSVSHQQHTGGSFHHHPRLHLCLCQYGMQSCQITSHTTSVCLTLQLTILFLPKRLYGHKCYLKYQFCHHLLSRMSIQTHMTFFCLLITEHNICQNVQSIVIRTIKINDDQVCQTPKMAEKHQKSAVLILR